MSAPSQPSGGNSSGSGRVRLGELLVQAGILSAEKLQEALKIQAAEGSKRRLGRLLVDQGFVDETLLTQLLGRQLSVPWVSLYHVDFSRQLLNLVPREVAEGYGLVPVYVRHVRGQGETLYVATDDPTNEEGMKRASAYAGLPVRPMIASASDIRSAIRAYYGGGKPEPAPAPAVGVKVETVEPPREPSKPPAEAKPAAEAKPPPQKPAELPKKATEPKPAEPTKAQEAPKVVVAEAVKPAPAEPPTPAPAESTKSQPVAAAPAAAPAPAKRPGPSPAIVAALAAAATAPPKAPRVEDDGPEIEATVIPPPKSKKTRGIALTFLDGTTIRLPAPRPRKVEPEPVKSETPVAEEEHQLTAGDLIAALRAVAQGAEPTAVLGENPRWEAMFAALLSLVMKKHLIADWEFVEEYKKMSGKP